MVVGILAVSVIIIAVLAGMKVYWQRRRQKRFRASVAEAEKNDATQTVATSNPMYEDAVNEQKATM